MYKQEQSIDVVRWWMGGIVLDDNARPYNVKAWLVIHLVGRRAIVQQA